MGQEPGTEFKEGPNIIRYKVYDQARNRAGCKFIVRIEGKFNSLNVIYHLAQSSDPFSTHLRNAHAVIKIRGLRFK